MKLAIIGTTIQGEGGYLRFDQLAAESLFSDVTFVIAGDVGGKPFDVSKFRCRVEYLEPKDQERFTISDTIGWKTPRRRPVAWLRAIEMRPDVILSVDDDNMPASDYFAVWHRILSEPVAKAVSAERTSDGEPWHNYLRTADAPFEIFPRGFPIPFRNRVATTVTDTLPVAPEAIGIYQGISIGDPDIDAMTRLVFPTRMPLSTVAEKNYVLKNVWSPYNMQNTVYRPELFGLPILWPSSGRLDDIYASYVMQQVLFQKGYYAFVGDPVNTQDRGMRDTLRLDFPLEVDGYRESHDVWREIHAIEETDSARMLDRLIAITHPAIAKERKFFTAYRNDSIRVLAS